MSAKRLRSFYNLLMGPINLDDMRRKLSREKPEQHSIRVKPSLMESFRRACDQAKMKQVDALEYLLLDFVKAVEEEKRKKKKSTRA